MIQSARPTLDDLLDAAEFTRRHIGPTPDEQQLMLAVVGAGSIDELLAQTVPGSILATDALAMEGPRREEEVLAEIRGIASRNVLRTSLIGMGYHGTVMPPVVQRNVLESPAWYTAYTPYQPEISQGRLEALLAFQTMGADLTGFDLANATLLDEATAAAEAMTMARRLAGGAASASDRFVVHHDTHPQPSPSCAPGPSRWASTSSSATSMHWPSHASARCSACRPRPGHSPTGATRSRRCRRTVASPSWPPTCSPAC
ncbi:MAG: glycine dehydrogenase [Actinomycetota bacterium]